MQRMIELPEDQVSRLEQLAARERRSLDEVVQFAVGDYSARQRRDWTDWGRRWDALAAEVQARMPTDVTPGKIEADITANFEEYLGERAAERHTEAGSVDAGGR